MKARICRKTVSDVAFPSPAQREALLALNPTRAGHTKAMGLSPVLDQVEVGGPMASTAVPDSLSVVFWNAERLKYVAPSAALLAGLNADVILLAEVDIGMARSGQGHTVRELADAMGMTYVYGTEFVELGLGDARERNWFAGHENRCSLHGGAILSRVPLSDPAIIRLPETGDWFDGSRGERRVGGRIAVLAKTPLGGRMVSLVSVHLESHGGPASRALEIAQLLPEIDAYADGGPVIAGGDFNTNTTERDVPDWANLRAALLRDDPTRLSDPVAYEPLFQCFSQAGYHWQTANAPGTTQRTRPDGTPTPPFAKLDWMFCSGLRAEAPAIHAATAPDGRAISDHEALSLQISLSD